MNDTEKILQAISDLHAKVDSGFQAVDARFQAVDTRLERIETDISEIKEQIKDIDESIGAIADWADDVAIATKVPFAGGGTSIK